MLEVVAKEGDKDRNEINKKKSYENSKIKLDFFLSHVVYY